ncbi:LacI family DNA-binding transcriptional regulator [Paracoccus marinaquae]|uniref:LacI family DNA-binding transcriptional regulator n=1 Tax=Paracoccus marinaquae TaxID=2841926 RepID=A0ABS6AMC0_9RHOB|nr:LacI family DNA-binding transcriptional regulator [Paracoccus marinaquae]MBU3031331.1 LacI family DNA-binding transcriptional regulator [Paracoccus marinaquae]
MASVGRMAGVSQVTVSRALSDPSKVSPETLRRIHEAIEATGFVPNALAGALASRRSRLITALVPSITNIVYSSLLHGFSDIMREHGYQIMLSETGFDPEREQEMIETHLARRPDGMLLTGIHHSAAARRMLIGSGTPVVEVWDITETPIDCCVGFSHAATGAEAAEFAIRAGYRRAATVTAGDQRAQRRRDAFVEGFRAATGEELPAIDFPPGTATLGQGRDSLRRLIEEKGFEAGVIFCSSDQYAHGILTEAMARNLRVPDQIAVIGFGDQSFAEHTFPSLTTVRIDRDALGKAAAKALLDRFENRPLKTSTINVGFEIIKRASA